MNILNKIRRNPKDSEFIEAAKEIIEDELYHLSCAEGEYEKNYILSVIYKNLKLLKDFS